MGENYWAEISAQYIQGPYWSYITLLLTDQDRVLHWAVMCMILPFIVLLFIRFYFRFRHVL